MIDSLLNSTQMKLRNLADYKKKTGKPAKELAKKLGISGAHLSTIIHGKRVPSRHLAKKISRITGIPVLDLLFPKWEKDKRKKPDTD